jgi:signal transduction histidine kinase
MKLLSKANLYYIATTLVIFLIAGIAVYISLQDLIYEEVDELLLEQKSVFIDELNELGGFAFVFLPKDSSIIVGPQITTDKMFQPEFRDTMLYSYLEDEVVPFRQIVFPAAYEDDIYVITIRRSLFESDDLIETIFFSLSGIFLIAVLIFTAVNFFGLRRLWHPFYRILEQIKTYNFRTSKNLKPVETNIDEFKELQTLLDRMTSKLSRDYQTLKEFSENASHEMQTPLAIIRSKPGYINL